MNLGMNIHNNQLVNDVHQGATASKAMLFFRLFLFAMIRVVIVTTKLLLLSLLLMMFISIVNRPS